MSAGLAFLLLSSGGFMAFITAAALQTEETEGPQRQPIVLWPMLLPAAAVLAVIVVATAFSRWAAYRHDWSVALNHVSYAVLIGCVAGLLTAVWINGKPAWCQSIVRLSARAAAHPGRAWLGALALAAAFVAGALSRS
ncbi:MAG: hypothetical protein AB7F22_15725 [Reyranella sp.]|uniref:hypothetical protein n=1 Tax=Reyranella sp. TaxID=1929291 RepID=UPI003D11860E